MHNYGDPPRRRDWLLEHNAEANAALSAETGKQNETDETEEAEDVTQARSQGQEMGLALNLVFGPLTTSDIKSVWTVATAFSKMVGYRDLEAGNEYIMGFIEGIQNGPGAQRKQLTASQMSSQVDGNE